MLVKEFSDLNLSFVIISEAGAAVSNGKSILSDLSKYDYKDTGDEVAILDLMKFGRNRKSHSGYIGAVNNCIVINQFAGIGYDGYLDDLTTMFPDKIITYVAYIRMDGHDSVTGNILRMYQGGTLVAELSKFNSLNTVFDRDNKFIPASATSRAGQLTKNDHFELMNGILESILKLKTLDGVKLKRFELIMFSEFNFTNNITSAIRNNLPEINDLEVVSARIGGQLRGMVREEDKAVMFPNTKETVTMIMNIIKELIGDSYELIKSKGTFRRTNEFFHDQIVVGGSDKVGFHISFSRRFLKIEEIVHKINAALGNPKSQNTAEICFILHYELIFPLYLSDSWNGFATNLYYYLRHGFEKCVPQLNAFGDLAKLNEYVNHSWSEHKCFLSYRGSMLRKEPVLQNCVVAILANDPEQEKIFEDRVFALVDEEMKAKYRAEFEKVKSALQDQ